MSLVVVSKVKKTIKDKTGMNTSASFITELSTIIEKKCMEAVECAKRDRRKTVMDRDLSDNA